MLIVRAVSLLALGLSPLATIAYWIYCRRVENIWQEPSPQPDEEDQTYLRWHRCAMMRRRLAAVAIISFAVALLCASFASGGELKLSDGGFVGACALVLVIRAEVHNWRDRQWQSQKI